MNDSREIVLKGRLNGSQRNRLAKLLDMDYRPSELAEEIGFNKRQVYRVYIPLGLPHDRDEKGHIWINGVSFKNWVTEVYKKVVIGPTETFCKTCRKPVKIVNPRLHNRYHLEYLLSNCPNCDRTCTRIVKNQRVER